MTTNTTSKPASERVVTGERVLALWFDAEGCGPDGFQIEMHEFPADMGGRIPAWLGLRVRAAGLVIMGADSTDGGFNIDRDQVARLHDLFSRWLVANPAAAIATLPNALGPGAV